MAAEIPRDNTVAPKAIDAQTDDGGKKPPPEMRPTTSAPDIPPTEGENKPTKTDIKEIREWGKFVVEVLTFLAVAYYACVASRQLFEMHEATVAATIGTNAAKNAADTASKALGLTAQLEQPIVAVDSIATQDFPDGKNPTLAIVFHNYGRSTAIAVRGNATLIVKSAKELQGKLPLNKGQNFTFPTIPSNVSKTRLLSLTESADWKKYSASVKGGINHFFIVGFVEYVDDTGKNFPRKEYCLIYDGAPGRPAPSTAFNFCEKHNE